MDGELRNYSSTETVENVFVFIADSVRTDAIPATLAKRGVTARAVAPSTFTASSVPSLLSGMYPSEHQVWDFDDRLPEKPLLLDEIPNTGFSADTIWTHVEPENKPPLRMTRMDEGDPLASISEPFVFVEHDKGGHSPYGYSFSECGSTEKFYREFLDDSTDVPDLYERGVHRAIDRFSKRLDFLERRGLLENTLVIFTSDHGEYLGEHEYGTIYEHGTPIAPEVVYVPMIFFGAGLPGGEEIDELLSGIDLVPTALGAQNRPVPSSLLGFDLWNRTPATSRTARSEIWKSREFRETKTIYAAASVWTRDGGHVFHRGPRIARAVYAIYWHGYASPHAAVRPLSPKAYRNLLSTYIPMVLTYGDPSISLQSAKGRLPGQFSKQQAGVASPEVDAYTKEQLEKLGYR